MTSLFSGAHDTRPQGTSAHDRRLPQWLKRPIASTGRHRAVCNCLADAHLHTVCVEAKCPNRSECYSRGTATFMILGNMCTRNCGFCSVGHGTVEAPDPGEPSRLAEAAQTLGLSHVVITSVTRDDLPDGGAAHFAACVRAVREVTKGGVTVELLVPDFGGDAGSLRAVLDSRPDILNHNVETVPRLYPRVRPMADYARSLELLSRAGSVNTKSGLMVGLGETEEEVAGVLRDLRAVGCRMLTIGQYLQPTPAQLPVEEFVHPALFERYRALGCQLGFSQVASGPFVRSSYRAGELFMGGSGERGATLSGAEMVESGMRTVTDGR